MKSNMATRPCFLAILFLFLGSISYTAAAPYEPSPPGYWQEVADARTDSEFNEEAQFAVREANVTGLVFVRVLEGQTWSTSLYGAPTTRRFLIEAIGATNIYKVYEGVVTNFWDAIGSNILESFEAVLD